MFPKILKALWLTATALLLLTFLTAWFKNALAESLSLVSSYQFHLTLGASAILFYFFIDLFLLFYFVGTGVWMRDRARETYISNKDQGQKIWQLYKNTSKIKARSMPFLSTGLLLGLFVFIFGGATQVGAVYNWVHPVLAALLCISSVIGTYFIFTAMNLNEKYLDQISEWIDSN